MTHTGKPPVPLAELEILHPPQSEETTLDLESQWASIANQKHFKSTILNAFCEHRQASYEQCRNFFCVQKFPSKLNRCEPIEVRQCVSNLGHHLTPISFQPRGVTLREELAKNISAFKI